MFAKICGTTNLEDARLSVALGAQALGFIFAPSKRRVSVEQAAAVTGELPPGVMRVGVFTEPDTEMIRHTVQKASLTAVQMHWRHDPKAIAELKRALGEEIALWQVVGFPIAPADPEAAERQFRSELRASLLHPALGAVLLDAVKGEASGGLGESFSWGRAAEIVRPLRTEAGMIARERARKLPQLVLAGGLRAENVAEAVRTLQPDGVDVVSGVEADPGKKSPDRLHAFFTALQR